MPIGVYICKCGGNISDIIDVEKVKDRLKELGEVVVNIQDYLCSSQGQGKIENDLKNKKVDKIVISACSPKLHEEMFKRLVVKQGVNPFLLELVNIREQCSWVHDDKEKATIKATSLTRGTVERMKELQPLTPLEKKTKDKVLIIGAGIAGITTALELADRHEVILIEKKPYIGGHMIGLSKTFPTLDCSQCILTPKMVAIHNHPNITLLTQTEISKIEGNAGDFTITLKQSPRFVNIEECINCNLCARKCPNKAIFLPFSQAIPQAYMIDALLCDKCGLCVEVCKKKAINLQDKEKEIKVEVGAIVLATGFEPLNPEVIEEYEYPSKNILTAVEFEEMLSAKSRTGMRLLTKEGKVPNSVAFVLCVGSRNHKRGNKHCSKVCCLYALKQALLVKKINPNAEVYIFYIELRSAGRRFEEFYDHTQEEGVKFIRGTVAELLPEEDKITVRYENTLIAEIGEKQFDMVVLCPSLQSQKETKKIAEILGLPIGQDGFIEEKHVKLDPVTSINQGVFACGGVLGPKDIHDSVCEGIASAYKTTQFLTRGKIEISPEKPMITNECDGCGICIKECVYSAMKIENGKAVYDILLCNGCGRCVPFCPKKAIEIKNYTRKQLKAQIKGILSEDKNVIVFLDKFAYEAADIAGVNRNKYSPLIRFVKVPSIHIIEEEICNYAFENNALGILIIEGNTDEKLTAKSMELFNKLRIALKQHRKPIRYSKVETAQYEKLMNLLNVFAEQCEKR